MGAASSCATRTATSPGCASAAGSPGARGSGAGRMHRRARRARRAARTGWRGGHGAPEASSVPPTFPAISAVSAVNSVFLAPEEQAPDSEGRRAMGKPLAPDTLVYDFTPANDPQISPDGTRIIYALGKTDRESKKATSQLWICDVDGGNARQLTQSGERNGGGRWSPDGGQIAFVSDRVGEKKRGIFVM